MFFKGQRQKTCVTCLIYEANAFLVDKGNFAAWDLAGFQTSPNASM